MDDACSTLYNSNRRTCWDKAIEEFKKLRDKEKAIVEDKGWTISSDCETDFEAYLEGYYVSHHTVGSLEEVEVQ